MANLLIVVPDWKAPDFSAVGKHVQNPLDGINICYCLAIEQLFRSIFDELQFRQRESVGKIVVERPLARPFDV
jgi:hypothetical protein